MPQLMGIINLTPDSFWEPSRCYCAQDAYEKILVMQKQGASIVDIGAASSRPGADEISEDEQWRRLEPLMQLLSSHRDVLPTISVDTTSSTIVRRTFEAIGNFIVNDISAGDDDPQMLSTVAALGLTYIAMHHRGTPKTMDFLTDYRKGVVQEVKGFFSGFADKAQNSGIKDWILDPGFGFAKNEEQNIELLENLGSLRIFGKKILAGVSGKRFTRGREDAVNHLLIRERADIIRVHDVESARKIFEK